MQDTLIRRAGLVTLLLPLLIVGVAHGDEEPMASTPHLSRFGEGDGPRSEKGVLRLLDAKSSPNQSNAVAFDRAKAGAFERNLFRANVNVRKGGDGGAVVLLNTRHYGTNGPAPFMPSVVEPNLKGTFAVGIDVHNPPNNEPFSKWGNYQSLPEREVSLHFDGREIVKRVAPAEFRGDFHGIEISVEHVVGGAEVTVSLASERVFDHYFIPKLLPYESRIALAAGTRADATTHVDVKNIEWEQHEPATARRRPIHIEVFNHVLTNNKKTSYEAEINLPSATWALGRVLLTLDIHDAGKNWDEWDRNGEISVWDDDGTKLGMVPFITSYRTTCHWVVDVTHFRPLLSGKRKFQIAAGTTFYKNRGYMMSVSLDYYHGAPPLVPYRVSPLWHGKAHYRSAENHFTDFFESKDVILGPETASLRLVSTTTGHSQIGEFTPSTRTVEVEQTDESSSEDRDAGNTKAEFENTLWKTDCYLNPNRPQFGTWKYSRAGWAPGDVVRPWWINLDSFARPDAVLKIAYVPEPYSFGDKEKAPKQADINKASHVVRAYLIEYRKPRALVPAPILVITNVAKDSNAAKAGLKRGDYFAQYRDSRIDSIQDLRTAIGEAASAKAESVVVVVYRGTKRIEVTMPTGKMGIGLGGG